MHLFSRKAPWWAAGAALLTLAGAAGAQGPAKPFQLADGGRRVF